MQKIISLLLIFCLIAVVNSQNCTAIVVGTKCGQEFVNFTDSVYLTSVPTNVNYVQFNQKISTYCSSQCKNTADQYFRCLNDSEEISFLNKGLCGKLNQEYCLVHHVRGTTTGIISPIGSLDSGICPSTETDDVKTLHCIGGSSCHQKLQKISDYLSCCTLPLFIGYYKLLNDSSCNITNSCSSGTVSPTITTFTSSRAVAGATSKIIATGTVGGVVPTVAQTVTPSRVDGGATPTKTVAPSGAIVGDSSLLVLITVFMIQIIVMCY